MRRSNFSQSIFFSVLVLALFAIGCGPSMPPLVARASPTSSPDGPIVVLGDTQRTTFTERLIGREQNEEARRALVAKLATEERPAFVVHLGDMVAVGDNVVGWEYFDRLVSPLTARGIRIFPVLGNHDYWGDDRDARRNVRRRFPMLAGGCYTLRHRGLGLVFLNSNLEGSLGREQTAWFERRLLEFELDDTVRAVVVFTHHPPFTNGVDREGSPYVHDELVPALARYGKAIAMMSGHVHGYERFVVGERTFVVSGGGGGPRVAYEMGSPLRPSPAYVTPDGRPRAFNYVVLDPRADRLDFTVKCLPLDAACRNGVLESFSVPFPRKRSAPAPSAPVALAREALR